MALPLLTSTKVAATRSEEHTSELQSQSNLVCRLLLEKQNDSMGPPLGERERLEFVGDSPEELVGIGRLLRVHLQHPGGVPGPPAVYSPGAGRAHRLAS